MTSEDAEKLKKYLEKVFPNKKYWILDPKTQTLAEQNEILREMKQYDKEVKEEQKQILNKRGISLN